jgi:hypothetical protein
MTARRFDRVRARLGLPIMALVGLATLGVPRVVVHDLDLGGAAATWPLAIAPPVVWLVVVVARRVPQPFTTLLVIGALYGVMLAVTHQLLWTEAFDGNPPRLGDRFADAPDWVHTAVTRGVAILSSLATGALVGALVGAIGAALNRRLTSLRGDLTHPRKEHPCDSP